MLHAVPQLFLLYFLPAWLQCDQSILDHIVTIPVDDAEGSRILSFLFFQVEVVFAQVSQVVAVIGAIT